MHVCMYVCMYVCMPMTRTSAEDQSAQRERGVYLGYLPHTSSYSCSVGTPALQSISDTGLFVVRILGVKVAERLSQRVKVTSTHKLVEA